MPVYIQTFRGGTEKYCLNTELNSRTIDGVRHLSPVTCDYPGGGTGPMVCGVVARIPGIPKQTHGMRFIAGLRGDRSIDGTTLGIHGRNSHYKNKDIGMANLLTALLKIHYLYSRGERGEQIRKIEKDLTTFIFHAPCNSDGSHNPCNDYHTWARRHIRRLQRNAETWHIPPRGKTQADYSLKEYAPFCKWMQVIRVDGSDSDFFVVGTCFVVDSPDDHNWVKLRPLLSTLGMPAANLGTLALAASQIHNNMGTPPPAMVTAILGSPLRELGGGVVNLDFHIAGPDDELLVRPVAIRSSARAQSPDAAQIRSNFNERQLELGVEASQALAPNAYLANFMAYSSEEELPEEGEIDEDGSPKTGPNAELFSDDDDAAIDMTAADVAAGMPLEDALLTAVLPRDASVPHFSGGRRVVEAENKKDSPVNDEEDEEKGVAPPAKKPRGGV